MEKIDCIYLMGGIGERTKLGFPKQFQMLGGKPVFIHGLEVLNNIPEINNIIIVTCDIFRTDNIINQYGITKNIKYVGNGTTRQESVYNGLLDVTTKNCLISEGVRPFVTNQLYRKIIDYNSKIVTPIRKSVSTVIDIIGNSYNRSDFGEVQMPQKFELEILMLAHERAKILNINNSTDDIDLMHVTCEKDIYDVYVIEGEEANVKITSPLDLIIAEAIYAKIINSNGDE